MTKAITSDLVKQLVSDDELFFTYQSNVAMFVYDAINRIDGYKSKEKIKAACNDGAVEFLNVLCGSAKGKRRHISKKDKVNCYKRF